MLPFLQMKLTGSPFEPVDPEAPCDRKQDKIFNVVALQLNMQP